MVKAIIFDFFGVFYTDLYWTWLAKKVPNLKEKREELSAINKKFDKNLINQEEFLGSLSKIVGVPASKIIPEMDAGAKFNDALVDLLISLKGRYKLGLLSNARASWLRPIMKKHDFEKYFDAIVISSEVGHIKPEPEIFKEALERLNVQKQEAIFIDDRPKNVSAAENLGIKSILYVSNKNLVYGLKKLNLVP